MKPGIVHGGVDYRQHEPLLHLGRVAVARLVAGLDGRGIEDSGWQVGWSVATGLELADPVAPPGSGWRWSVLAHGLHGALALRPVLPGSRVVRRPRGRVRPLGPRGPGAARRNILRRWFIYEAERDEDHPMRPALTMDGAATAMISLIMPQDSYLHRLRALAAWWSLGSSGLEPQVLMRYAPVALSVRRQAEL